MHLYEFVFMLLYVCMLLYTCICAYIGMFWLAFVSHPISLPPLAKRNAPNSKEATQNCQIQS